MGEERRKDGRTRCCQCASYVRSILAMQHTTLGQWPCTAWLVVNYPADPHGYRGFMAGVKVKGPKWVGFAGSPFGLHAPGFIPVVGSPAVGFFPLRLTI